MKYRRCTKKDLVIGNLVFLLSYAVAYDKIIIGKDEEAACIKIGQFIVYPDLRPITNIMGEDISQGLKAGDELIYRPLSRYLILLDQDDIDNTLIYQRIQNEVQEEIPFPDGALAHNPIIHARFLKEMRVRKLEQFLSEVS